MIRYRMKDAVAHIAFAVKLCLLQARAGRKFMIEQPAGASSWGTQLMNKLLFVKGRGQGELRLLHVRHDDKRPARNWTRQAAYGHHHQLSGVAHGAEDISATGVTIMQSFLGVRPEPARSTPASFARQCAKSS